MSVTASYAVIYDAACNLCVTLVRFLAQWDQGQQFQYVPMQACETLQEWGITAQDCELGMILLDLAHPDRRWQGSAAAEEIGHLLPWGNGFVQLYRALPGMKWVGDGLYAFIRDHRYDLFGKRNHLYQSAFPVLCNSDRCRPRTDSSHSDLTHPPISQNGWVSSSNQPSHDITPTNIPQQDHQV